MRSTARCARWRWSVMPTYPSRTLTIQTRNAHPGARNTALGALRSGVLGDAGRRTRSAVGVAALPRRGAVEEQVSLPYTAQPRRPAPFLGAQTSGTDGMHRSARSGP